MVGYAAVVFDLDGTLTDSQAGIIASYQQALAAYGISADATSITPWIGPPLSVGFGQLGVPKNGILTAVQIYRSYFSEVGIYQNRLYDGVTDLLADLQRAGLAVALATSKLTEFARRILAHLEIAGYFDVVAGADRDGSRVAKKDIVGLALEELGWPGPATVALVGDRADDMLAAVHFGLLPVGASWGYGSIGELEASGSQVILGEPADVLSVLFPA